MIIFVRVNLREKDYREEEATHVRFRFSALLHVFGDLAPILADVTQNQFKFFLKEMLGDSQRVVNKVGFYASGKVRMDNTMMQRDDEDERFS